MQDINNSLLIVKHYGLSTLEVKENQIEKMNKIKEPKETEKKKKRYITSEIFRYFFHD